MTNKLHVYTGEGKGKTTAGMGLALRSVGHGNRVLVAYYFNREQQAQQPLAASMQSAAASNEAFDQMADYAMIDVSDMYAYVSDY